MSRKFHTILGVLVWLLTGMAPVTAAALAPTPQGKLPDLTPVVVNAGQGSVEVRNIGNATADPSQLYVVCSTFVPGEKGGPCAAGLHLPGYIEKWNSLPFDIPALKPGASYRVRLFGKGVFQRKPENVYGMGITSDPLRKIAESNEKNNSARLTVSPPPKPRNAVGSGRLQVTVMMDGKPIKAAVDLLRPGQTAFEMPSILRRDRMKQTPFEASWHVGKYDLYIHSEVSSPMNMYMQSKALPIEIKKGQLLKKTLTIPSGRMRLSTTVEGKKAKNIKVTISGLHGEFTHFSALGSFKTPIDITVPAGQYKLEAKSVEEKQTQTAEVEIKAGSTINKTLNFDKLRIGYLKVNVLIKGKPVPIRFNWPWGFDANDFRAKAEGQLLVSNTGEPAQRLENRPPDKPIVLRAGEYDLKVHEVSIGGKDIEPIKGIVIREGETVEKTVEIRQPGRLNIKAQWAGQPYNIVACAEYHNPLNPQRLGGLMGGNGNVSRGGCLDPNVYLAASVSSPGRSDGDIAKNIYFRNGEPENAHGKRDEDQHFQTLEMAAGVYNLCVWPSGHPELKQTLKNVAITSAGITDRKLKFRWPGKKK